MSGEPRNQLTEQEYLALERSADARHEYHAGTVTAPAGGSALHSRIALNALTALQVRLTGRPCRVYGSDLRITIPHSRSFVYPDGSVVCGEERFSDERQDALLNPTLVLEVLSPSTEGHDRGRKFAWYRTIDSLQDYLLVAQDTRRIDRFTRQSDVLWSFRSYAGADDVLVLPSLSIELPVAAVYQQITFSE